MSRCSQHGKPAEYCLKCIDAAVEVRLNELREVARGGLRLAANHLCADDVCDAMHPGWESCAMWRKWVGVANKALASQETAP